MRTLPALVLIVVTWVACGRTEPVRYELLPGPMDAGRDAGPDAGLDAGVDAGEKPCIDGRFPLNPATPVVVLALDKSGSMSQDFTGAASKWEALRATLRTTLPSVDRTMELGLLLYPVSDEQACSSFSRPSPEPAVGQVSQILMTLDAIEPSGGTPTADAVFAATNSLLSRRTASTARAIVLATDGLPNCNGSNDPRTCRCPPPMMACRSIDCVDDDRTVSRITAAADAGIPTYVVGIETLGSTFETSLDRMAIAGGRPRPPGGKRYYAASSGPELQQAFTTIRDQVARCTFLTASVPNATGSIRVESNGLVLPFDPSGMEGWNWTDRANGELVFRGMTCAQVMVGNPRLEAVVACGR